MYDFDDYNEWRDECNEVNFEQELRELTSTADEMSVLNSLKYVRMTPPSYRQ